ncbi:uroporphyrinogen-III synthase, partial [Bacillus sp. D-CC]
AIVHFFVHSLQFVPSSKRTKLVTVACIGPITEKEASLYFPHIIMPKEYTVEALLQCICESIK